MIQQYEYEFNKFEILEENDKKIELARKLQKYGVTLSQYSLSLKQQTIPL